MILVDSTYCIKKKTSEPLQGVPEDSIVEGTMFKWVIDCDYDVQEVKDGEEDHQLEMLSSFKGSRRPV